MSAKTDERNIIAFLVSFKDAGPPPWSREKATELAKVGANMLARSTCVIFGEGGYWPCLLGTAIDNRMSIVEHFEPEEQSHE